MLGGVVGDIGEVDPEGSVDVLASHEAGPDVEFGRGHIRVHSDSRLRGRSCRAEEDPSTDAEREVALCTGVGHTESVTADVGYGEETRHGEDA